MTDNQKNNNEYRENSYQKSMNVARAGVVGLLLGAVGTAALVLSDHEMRKRATKKAGDLSQSIRNWSSSTIKIFKSRSSKIKEDLKEDLDEITDKQKEILANAKVKTSRSIH